MSLENVKKAKKLAKEGTNSDSQNVATKSWAEHGIQPRGSSIAQLPVSTIGVASQHLSLAQKPQSSGSFLGLERKGSFRTPLNHSLLLRATKVKVETGVLVIRGIFSVLNPRVKAMMASDPPKRGTEDIITRFHELLLSKHSTLLHSKKWLHAAIDTKSNMIRLQTGKTHARCS